MLEFMDRGVKSTVKRLEYFLVESNNVLKSLSKVHNIVKQESYSPKMPRKSYVHRYLDNVVWAIKFHEANRFYNLYSMDLKGRANTTDPNYIDYHTFYLERNKVNALSSPNDNHIILLRDKHLMSTFLDYYSVPTAVNIAVIFDGVTYDMKGNQRKFSELVDLENVDYFLKKVDGECADGVFHITSMDQLENFKFLSGKYVLQERVIQHPEMNVLWDGAINTCRVCTLYDGKNVSILSAVLRVGTKASRPVDNWAHGGISVGVHEDGRLVDFGVYKPGYGGRAYEHPDTGVKFCEFIIPEYEEVKKLCIKAHLLMREIPAIGWDIAITPNGPLIIEGNDNWEISLMQASNHGLKKEWNQFIKDYTNNRG